MFKVELKCRRHYWSSRAIDVYTATKPYTHLLCIKPEVTEITGYSKNCDDSMLCFRMSILCFCLSYGQVINLVISFTQGESFLCTEFM